MINIKTPVTVNALNNSVDENKKRDIIHLGKQVTNLLSHSISLIFCKIEEVFNVGTDTNADNPATVAIRRKPINTKATKGGPAGETCFFVVKGRIPFGGSNGLGVERLAGVDDLSIRVGRVVGEIVT